MSKSSISRQERKDTRCEHEMHWHAEVIGAQAALIHAVAACMALTATSWVSEIDNRIYEEASRIYFYITIFI